MVKKLKLVCTRIVVCILLIETILSSMGAGIANAYTKEEVAAAIGGLAEHVVDTYGDRGAKVVVYNQSKRKQNPLWNSSYSWSTSGRTYYFDCISFAVGCYKYGAGMNFSDPSSCSAVVDNFSSPFSDYFEEIVGWGYDINNLQTGDLCIWSDGSSRLGPKPDGTPREGHAMIYVNSSRGFAENGKAWKSNAQSYVNKRKSALHGFHVYRVSDAGAAKVTNLNTEFSITLEAGGGVAGSLGSGGEFGGSGITEVTYAQFFFNGKPDGQYSMTSKKNIFEILVDALKDLVNFFTGILSYMFRGVLIGIISVFDRLLNNTIKSVDSSTDLKEDGVTSTSADDPLKMNRSVTIEGLIFNEIDLFDINIFKVDNDEEEQVPEVVEVTED